MRTQCTAEQLEFSSVGRREVVAAFDGGTVCSDAGALLLGKADAAIGLLDHLARHIIRQAEAVGGNAVGGEGGVEGAVLAQAGQREQRHG